MIILDYQDRRPIYEQVAEKFRILILREILPPGSRMPSVRQLAMELSINPNTIQRAYMELEQEGLIYPVKGKGNFVSDASKIRKRSHEDYDREFRGVVQRGIELGIGEQHLTEVVRECFRNSQMSGALSAHGRSEKEDDNDSDSGMQ